MTQPLGNLQVEVRVGSADRPSIGLCAGQPPETLSVGRQGAFRLSAPGVADVHAYLYFDGESLFIASAGPDCPVWVDGKSVSTEWLAVEPPAELVLAGARLWVAPEQEAEEIELDSILENSVSTVSPLAKGKASEELPSFEDTTVVDPASTASRAASAVLSAGARPAPLPAAGSAPKPKTVELAKPFQVPPPKGAAPQQASSLPPRPAARPASVQVSGTPSSSSPSERTAVGLVKPKLRRSSQQWNPPSDDEATRFQPLDKNSPERAGATPLPKHAAEDEATRIVAETPQAPPVMASAPQPGPSPWAGAPTPGPAPLPAAGTAPIPGPPVAPIPGAGLGAPIAGPPIPGSGLGAPIAGPPIPGAGLGAPIAGPPPSMGIPPVVLSGQGPIPGGLPIKHVEATSKLQVKESFGAMIARSWREASIPQKAILALLPFAIGSVFVIFKQEPASQSASKSASTADSANVIVNKKHHEPDPSATPDIPSAQPPGTKPQSATSGSARPAPTPPAPPQAPGKPKKKDPKEKTVERMAVDAVAAGTYPEALRFYEQLQAEHPESGAYREAVRILRLKISGGGGQTP